MRIRAFRHNGQVYISGLGPGKGFGGAMWLITYPDGTELVTDNLELDWTQKAANRPDLPEAKLESIGLLEYRERLAAQGPSWEPLPVPAPPSRRPLPVLSQTLFELSQAASRGSR